ncbi:MAG: hypothetical protein JWP81_3924 [Ferruginibacter sp.]|nr:hypothetical protein [Ferruginibacter sp.]
MLKNYLKIAIRNISKHKLFSFINIFGLATGMTVCMLALIKIKDAYDYDSFHPNAKRTYRILTNLERKNGDHFLCASSPAPLSAYLKNNYTAIDKSTSIRFSQEEVSANDKKLPVKEAYVDPDFYHIFGFRLKSGSPATRPQTAVLTIETAERFFGKDEPVGKIITIGKSAAFVVTGILENPPYSSHLRFDLLAASAGMPVQGQQKSSSDWADEAGAYTYVQLKPGATEKNLNSLLKLATGQVNKMLAGSNKTFVFDTQPLNSISPGTRPLYNLTAEQILPNLLVFALIGLSMLLLAFFNYVNLTLARSLDRAREVGIRKVAGALRKNLLLQFLGESVLMAMLAFCLAYFQLKLISTLPTVQRMIGDALPDGRLWMYFILFTMLTGLTAGWIPARVLSSFQPVRVLKGKFNTRLFGGAGLRKTLTVIQFAVSLIAIITLAVFYRQSMYMATADYGFNRERILNIKIPAHSYEKTAVAISSVAGIEQVSGSSGLFGFSAADTRFVKAEKSADSLAANYFSVNPAFISNMGMQLIAGDNLPAAVSTGEKRIPSVLINETAVRELVFKDPSDAVGKLIWLNDSTKYAVAGVIKDFHFASLLRPIQPLLLAWQPEEFTVLSVKVSAAAIESILPRLEKTWKELYPHQPLNADWFDKQLYDQNLHKDDLLFIGLLTVMAVSIACLGLLGMVIFSTQNRSKEVGIRRVMGAGVGRVIGEISREFVLLLLIAVCIGLPLGFFAGNAFLQQYAYRIAMSFWILAGSAAALLLLGALIIGLQTYRIAIANPTRSLRTE